MIFIHVPYKDIIFYSIKGMGGGGKLTQFTSLANIDRLNKFEIFTSMQN